MVKFEQFALVYTCLSYVSQWCNPLSPSTLGNLMNHLCWAWLAGSGWGIHTGGYLSTDDTERSHFLLLQHLLYNIIIITSNHHTSTHRLRYSTATTVTHLYKTTKSVSKNGNITNTLLYYSAMSYHFTISPYKYITITITISIYPIIWYHNIILSLCALPSSVTMTIIHTTDTGWLPRHDTTTKYNSRSTCNKVIWGKKD